MQLQKGICFILNYFTLPKEPNNAENLVNINRYDTDKDADNLKTFFKNAVQSDFKNKFKIKTNNNYVNKK